ncbi:MAG: ribonuclease HI [Peptococcaceae bacterium]|nr:ribonuclease HI [Peptococcaceae bacterium]
MTLKKVVIYTDGACSGNPGPGGWGAVLRYGQHTKEVSGYEEMTTNQRMELTAAIEALELLKEPCEVELYSDSAYLINAFKQKWLQKWLQNGWLNAQKKQVENIDLWKRLLDLDAKHKIKWIKVKGHAGNPDNEKCDQLARKAIAQGLLAQQLRQS